MNLYQAARIANTAHAAFSSKPGRIENRAINVAIGRGLARADFWNALWRGAGR